MLNTRKKTAIQEIDVDAVMRDRNALRTENLELKAENRALMAEMEGNRDHSLPWSIMKVIRQRHALDYLTARNTRLRFQIRCINLLGRGLTADEFRAARDQIEREDVQERIGKFEDE